MSYTALLAQARPPPSHPVSLRHTGTADAWGAHLGENLVKPLQRPIQVQLDPAGGAGHCLSPARHRERRGGGRLQKRPERHTSKSKHLFLLSGESSSQSQRGVQGSLLGSALEETPLTCWDCQAKLTQPGRALSKSGSLAGKGRSPSRVKRIRQIPGYCTCPPVPVSATQ